MKVTFCVRGVLAGNVGDVLTSQGFLELPITVRDAEAAGSLPGLHRDPFDRMLIAQATLANLVLVSNEAVFDRYGIRRLGRLRNLAKIT